MGHGRDSGKKLGNGDGRGINEGDNIQRPHGHGGMVNTGETETVVDEDEGMDHYSNARIGNPKKQVYVSCGVVD